MYFGGAESRVDPMAEVIASHRPTASLDIIIVNWNSGEELRDCFDSLSAARRLNYTIGKITIVDNASTDGSAERLRSHGLPLTVIRNVRNLGFAAACNQGAKGSLSNFLLFLNPDVRVFTDSLEVPLEFMQRPENACIGICGIQLVNAKGHVARSCSRFPTVGMSYSKMLGLDWFFPGRFDSHYLRERDHAESREVEQIMGAFFLVRRELFEELNGFDERFFVYFEDVDFSYRSRQNGWHSYYLATTQAVHKGEGCTENVRAARLFYSLRSRIIYGYKHFRWPGATCILIGTILLEPFTRLAWAAWRRSSGEMIETLQAYVRLWRAMPILLWNLRVSGKTDESCTS